MRCSPVLAKTDSKDIEIKSGDNTLDFTLTFDAKKDTPKTGASQRRRRQPPEAPCGRSFADSFPFLSGVPMCTLLAILGLSSPRW